MNRILLIIIVALVVGTISAFALSPYFTESTIDEALPVGAVIQPMMDDTMMDDTMMDDTMMDDTMMDDTMMDDTMMDDTMMDDTMMDDSISIFYAGTFVGIDDGIHDAQGEAYTVPLDDGNNILRLENFKATNGPDLFVYLSTDKNASEFVNLGKLKASNGNQNYEIPNEIDLTQYNKVLIWCKAFGVLFGSAELMPQ